MVDIVILGAARTAIGTFGGALAATPPITLGAVAAKAALERAGVEGGQIGHVAFGHVINTEPRDMYLSRVAAMEAGVPETTPAMNVNRLCGSGAQAVVSVVQALQLGDADFGLAGGAESMSRSPYILPQARWGQKMGDAVGAGHDAGRAELSVRDRAYGRHRRERGRRDTTSRGRIRMRSRLKARPARRGRFPKGVSRIRSCRSRCG